METKISILPARADDAPAIARAIVEAVGVEHCLELAGPGRSIDAVLDLFAEMARREDTQYSYRRALVACDADGEVVGVCVAYDGGQLDELRRPFLERAAEVLGIDPGEVTDETEPGEYYIDTLAVRRDMRGQGIGRLLLMAAAERGRQLGLRPGLLVDKANPKARALYESAGFADVGERPFFGIVMDHMQG